jgi:SAM-dependent methyltransferase
MGTLTCQSCGAQFPIQEGIAVLSTNAPLVKDTAPSTYETEAMLTAYLWSHFADLMGDRDASPAYGEWSELLNGTPGYALDAGCAVGRFTFEMGQKCGFAVGIDSSYSFVRTARHLMTRRELSLSIPREGMLQEEMAIRLPHTWSTDRVEFVVGDAQRLPFSSGSFSSLASLNLVDKLPLPIVHVQEMNRVAKVRHAQWIFSDPFSWSSDVASPKDWVGGTSKGRFSGSGLENIRLLLGGEKGKLSPPWRIGKEGQVWWKIRNHQNHFELIRSLFLTAER